MDHSQLAVDSVFSRMLVRYGDGWKRLWTGIPIDAVKADWRDQIGGMPDYAIRYALENLPPERPPTAAAFRAICQRAPAPDVPALAAPRPTEEQKRRVRSIVEQAKQRMALGRLRP